jgi:hypothetical protein
MDVQADGSKKTRDVCGTAFTLGGGNYLTAGHVWKTASSFPLQGIGLGTATQDGSEHMLIRKIVDAAAFDTVDVAVLQVGFSFGSTFAWNAKPPALLDPVRAFGYPFGFDSEAETLTVRAFQGHIVGGGKTRRFSGRPAVSEVSFPCPRGLSGSPLIRHGDPSEIVGMILGNEISEMTVYTETEKLIESGQEKTLMKTEALHLGLAIRASELLPLSCSLLGGSIEAWLSSHGIPVAV